MSSQTPTDLDPRLTVPPKKEFTMMHGFLSILLAAGMITFLSECMSSANDEPAKTDSGSLNIGDTVFLASSDGKGIGGAATSEAFSALQKAFMANDDEGVQELVAAGEVIVIQSGTTARYLDFEIAGPRIVRLLDGQFAGRKVWLLGDYAHKYYRPVSTK